MKTRLSLSVDLARRLRERTCAVAAAFLVGVFATATAFPQTLNSIESIEVTYSKAGKTIVRLHLAAPASGVPVSSTVNNPPKITLDFTDRVGSIVYSASSETPSVVTCCSWPSTLYRLARVS